VRQSIKPRDVEVFNALVISGYRAFPNDIGPDDNPIEVRSKRETQKFEGDTFS